MIRTFVDSSVLIAAIRGPLSVSERAIALLDDPERVFLSSDIVRLEVLPKAIFHRQEIEAAFYERYFQSVAEHAHTTADLIDQAFAHAVWWNLSAFDALHVATAQQLQADELATAERATSPLMQVDAFAVVTIRDEHLR